jgi:hemoglobin
MSHSIHACIFSAAATLMACLAGGNLVLADSSNLFERMGGAPVLHAAVDRFTDIVIADDRINFTFAETDLNKFKQLLYEQLCSLAGGPCRYSGRTMAESHAKLDITTAEFNALAEDLYIALKRSGVPYRLQNKLLALLAPLKRDIVKGGHRVAPSEPAKAADKASD